MAVVQLAAFWSTLCRKGLLSCAGWHACYTLALLAVFAVHLTSQRVAFPGEAQPRLRELELIVPAMLVVTALRMSPRCDRRLLWGAVILVHAAAVRMCHTLDVVSP